MRHRNLLAAYRAEAAIALQYRKTRAPEQT